MNSPNETWIERYLDGGLSPEEAAVFERQLEADKDLAKALELALQARLAVGVSGREAFKTELKGRYRRRGTQPLWIWSGVVLAAAALVLLLLLVPGSREKATPEALFAVYYETPPFSTLRQGSQDQRWEEVGQAYRAGEFGRCADLLEAILADHNQTGSNRAWYYLGLCRLEEQRPQEALDALKMAGNWSAYSQEAQWYQALACLQAGALQEARSILQEIGATPGHRFHGKAVELLEQLPEEP